MNVDFTGHSGPVNRLCVYSRAHARTPASATVQSKGRDRITRAIVYITYLHTSTWTASVCGAWMGDVRRGHLVAFCFAFQRTSLSLPPVRREHMLPSFTLFIPLPFSVFFRTFLRSNQSLLPQHNIKGLGRLGVGGGRNFTFCGNLPLYLSRVMQLGVFLQKV